MKRINEMTNEEILALTEDQILTLKQLAWAEAGVPLEVKDPGPKPEKPQIKNDFCAYKVTDILIKDMETAGKIISLLENTEVYDTEGYGDETRYIRISSDHYGYPVIKKVEGLSPNLYDEKKNLLKKYRTDLEAYEVRKKEFDRVTKMQEEAAQNLEEKIEAAKYFAREEKYAREQFLNYLKLAEGNTTVAMRFLLKAKPMLKVEHPNLVLELAPDYKE